MSKASIDLSASVIAVPPLARNADLTINARENARLINHLHKGGITHLLYGGNANFYNIGLYEYAEILDTLAAAAPAETLLVPSVGPDYGRLMDQAPILKARGFPTAMVLPASAVSTPAGVVEGLRRFAEAFGRPIVVYVKSEDYLRPQDVALLVDAGIVAWIKYAIPREDPAQDPFLDQLLERVDRRYVVSGIGELPTLAHFEKFQLAAFTSGSACLAPAISMRLLRALLAKDAALAREQRAAFLELEGLRNSINPIRVLHEAVTLAGIADTGPILPLLANLPADRMEEVRAAARRLLKRNAPATQAA